MSRRVILGTTTFSTLSSGDPGFDSGVETDVSPAREFEIIIAADACPGVMRGRRLIRSQPGSGGGSQSIEDRLQYTIS
jgi:hypothetical protein